MLHNIQSESNTISQARKEILVYKNYKKALSILDNITTPQDSEQQFLVKDLTALIYLETGNYRKAAEIYRELENMYSEGFCELLLGNEDRTRELWDKAPESAAREWGKCLLNFIHLKKGSIPTFLQIRNHLETDLGYFLQAEQHQYAENLIKNDNLFITINLESYKLIGRTLLIYGFMNPAKKALLKSLETIPDDAETLYFLGQYNYLTGFYRESKKILEKSLEKNSSYVPARNLLRKLQLKMNNKF